MNTVVVFLAVALGAWLWSVVGMIVAVPLLVVMRVLCDHLPGLERLGSFLSADPAPLPPAGPESASAGPAG
jgi:predicted PurR-regulated permease PerM